MEYHDRIKSTIPVKNDFQPIAVKDIILCMMFVFFWIVPLSYRGFFNRDFPHFPQAITYLSRTNLLFSTSVSYWPQYFIQFQFEPYGHWVTVPTEAYFRMPPFGYRIRLTQLYNMKYLQIQKANQELAAWLPQRYAQLHPNAPFPLTVRLLEARHYLKKHPMPAGHWEDIPLEEFPAQNVVVMFVSSVTSMGRGTYR